MFEDLSYINAKDLLESLGMQNISESNGELSFSCPGPDHFHGDRIPSARMNSRTTAGLCHGCGKRFNAIIFLSWHKSLPETIARRLLEERYGGGNNSAEVGSLETEVKRIMNPEIVEEETRIPPAESWLEAFRVDWKNPNWCQHCSPDPQTPTERACCGCDSPPVYKQYIYDRNFDSDSLEKYEIGYDQLSERITIPIRDHVGKLIGFKGRAYRQNIIPRYMILGDNRNQIRYGFQPYQKSKYVYNLDRFIKFWGDEDISPIILCEGELNVIAMWQHGYSNVVGISGSEFSDTQCDLIKKYATSATLFLDNDKAGEKGTKKVAEMLHAYMPVSIVNNARGDAAELDTNAVNELVRNAKTYLELQISGQV